MPNWKIHLEVGKRLNKWLKYEKSDYEEFLLGNLLPDINNGFIVSGIKKIKKHEITHFDNKKDFQHHLFFLKKYFGNIKEPLYLGYYVHLITDYYFNYHFYTEKIVHYDISNYSKKEITEMKQHDFKLFNNKYLYNTIKISDIKNVLNKIKIDEVKIDEEDIKKVIN